MSLMKAVVVFLQGQGAKSRLQTGKYLFVSGSPLEPCGFRTRYHRKLMNGKVTIAGDRDGPSEQTIDCVPQGRADPREEHERSRPDSGSGLGRILTGRPEVIDAGENHHRRRPRQRRKRGD